ncbi:MAG: hypothetical protein ACXVNF_02920 [Neobacillus sp.]
MRYFLMICLFIVCQIANAQYLGFSCEGVGKIVGPWKLSFEIDQDTLKGVEHGLACNALKPPKCVPYSKDIDVVFTPSHMRFKELGSREFDGSIDRKNLRFSYFTLKGTCEIVPVHSEENKF